MSNDVRELFMLASVSQRGPAELESLLATRREVLKESVGRQARLCRELADSARMILAWNHYVDTEKFMHPSKFEWDVKTQAFPVAR